MPFASLGLMPELVRALAERNYAAPTPVQAKVIPEILAGRDILAGSQTGTGKTAGFTLPLLQLLSPEANPPRAPRALVLVPTRELAAQVGDSVKAYGKYLRLRTAVIFGGVSINPQIDTLRRGVDILVATPGRLLDHAEQRTVDLSQVQILVLDEADRMLDMGFIRDIRRVLKLLPPKRQNLMFSATYSKDIRELAQSMLRNPAEIEVARNTAVAAVEQRIYQVRKEDKRALLSHLIKEGNWSQVLVFTRTKHGANRLTKQLMQDGIEAAAIHGNKSQNARTQALADFKSFKIQALVATEVASRGLDIKELPFVVNFELPNVPEDYVHRIGRTGRAGATGIAVSLVSSDEQGLLRDIEKVLRKQVPVVATPAFPPAPPPVPEHNQRHRDPRSAQHPPRRGREQPRPKQGQPRAQQGTDGNRQARSNQPRSNQGQPRVHVQPRSNSNAQFPSGNAPQAARPHGQQQNRRRRSGHRSFGGQQRSFQR
jgi:ATP-dependent RNA helicase RhlE